MVFYIALCLHVFTFDPYIMVSVTLRLKFDTFHIVDVYPTLHADSGLCASWNVHFIVHYVPK